jgi:hypothetical protein
MRQIDVSSCALSLWERSDGHIFITDVHFDHLLVTVNMDSIGKW